MRRTIPIVVLSVLSGLAQAQTTSPFNCNNFLTFNGDQSTTLSTFRQSPETMAWNWFVCLNQADGSNGGLRVWETFKPSDQVYRLKGAEPLPYSERENLPSEVPELAQKQGMDPKGLFQFLGNDTAGSPQNGVQQVDGLALKMRSGAPVPPSKHEQLVRFHLMMGKDTFNYIVANKVYNRDGLAKLTSNLDFPATAWELKTSWFWIGTDQGFKTLLAEDGYYISQAYYVDSTGQYQVGYAALSGMHVINKLTPDWVWTTFENRNNPKYTVTNDTPPKPMTNITGPTDAAKPVNISFQQQYSNLAQYELIGVQYDQHQAEPKLLANSQLESAFQGSSSCLACHSTAAYSTQKNNFFSFNIDHTGGILYPTSVLPDKDFVGYQKLDYVWSLKRAQWKR
ncbi:hypothetical protein ACMGG8_07365 [Pseudomonas sp. BNK-45]|uniref:hypothetical protein n=1 Tax=Pseudomonas sp. BNK-45 TaxID=3376180 RepID=UPI0039BF4186